MDKRFRILRRGDVRTVPMCKNCGLCCLGYGHTEDKEGTAFPCEMLDKDGCTYKDMLCKHYVCISIKDFLSWIDIATDRITNTNRKYVKKKKVYILLKETLLRKGKDLTLRECSVIKRLLKKKGVK